jgi:hypothetical protein
MIVSSETMPLSRKADGEGHGGAVGQMTESAEILELIWAEARSMLGTEGSRWHVSPDPKEQA